MVAIWGIGFLLAGFFPLPSPADSAHAVAQMYAGDRAAIRIGLALTLVCSGLLAPFIGVISAQMRRIEGTNSPLAFAQLALGALLIIEFVYPMMILQVAAYRADRPDDDIQVIHDLGWMLFVGVVCTAIMQLMVIGVVILQDRREQPIFPRWSGYFNFWAALLIAGPSLIPFFTTGPFAWNGLFSWWIGVTAFAIWLFVMTYLLLRAIDRDDDTTDGISARRQVELLSSEVAALRTELVRVAALAEAPRGDGQSAGRSRTGPTQLMGSVTCDG
jgi:hypothetical protein